MFKVSVTPRLEDQSSSNVDLNNDGLNLNNQVYNAPILSSCEIFVLTPIVLLLVFSFMVPIHFNLKKEYATEYSLLVLEIFGLCFYGIILPFYFMCRKKVIRMFLWTEFKKIIA